MKYCTMNTNRTQELAKARIDALDGTSEALTCIIRQQELTEMAGESGMAEICDARTSAEDAMFYLAAASADDDDKVRKILSGYGLERLCDSPSSGIE